MFQFSQTSNQRRAGVDSRLIKLSDRALEISVVDFGIPKHGGKRESEEQHQLFLDGKSKADGTNDLSYHQTGKALDFYAFVDGKASWHPVKTTGGVPHGWGAGHIKHEHYK